jgi:hypothetical protein
MCALPTLETLLSHDDARLARELRLHDVKRQLAVVRSLLDEFERTVTKPHDRVAGQLAEELARLGCRSIEIASTVAPCPKPPANKTTPRTEVRGSTQ